MAQWGRSQSNSTHPGSKQEETQTIQTRTWLPSTRDHRMSQATVASSSPGPVSSTTWPRAKPIRQTPAVAASRSFLATPSHLLDLPSPLPAQLSSPTSSTLKPPPLKMVIFHRNQTLSPSRWARSRLLLFAARNQQLLHSQVHAPKRKTDSPFTKMPRPSFDIYSCL